MKTNSSETAVALLYAANRIYKASLTQIQNHINEIPKNLSHNDLDVICNRINNIISVIDMAKETLAELEEKNMVEEMKGYLTADDIINLVEGGNI